MAYHDNKCDECGRIAELVSPMYCLCFSCFDADCDDETNDEGEEE